MPFQTILVETLGATRVVTLNRPERRNAISTLLMSELAEALAKAGADAANRAVIITGGPECFSSGRDLSEAAKSTPAQRETSLQNWAAIAETIENLARPVVAAIEGHCLTGGLELALACDLRVAGEGASFGITSSRLGTIPSFGGTQRLPRAVGVSNALAMLFSAEPIDADEAYRIGLINRKTAKGEALREALAIAGVYTERAPLSLAAVKQAVRGGMQMELREALELERKLGATLALTHDRAEGMAAFREKRKPQFEGR